MDDRSAFFLCVVIAAAGIVLLAVSLHEPAPQQVSISELGKPHYGRTVEVSGEVKSAYQRSGNLFLTICSGKCVKAVIFQRTLLSIAGHGSNPFLLTKGDRIRAIGEAQEYQGIPELVIEELEVLD